MRTKVDEHPFKARKAIPSSLTVGWGFSLKKIEKIKANAHTMTTTGYKNLVFTEINPTSTTTTILVVYNRLWIGAITYTLGPYTVIPHETPVTTPTPTPPPTTKQPDPTVACTPATTVTVSSPNSATTVPPNCEFLVTAFLAVVYWLSPFPVCPLVVRRVPHISIRLDG
jgi:hypothetical protein